MSYFYLIEHIENIFVFQHHTDRRFRAGFVRHVKTWAMFSLEKLYFGRESIHRTPLIRSVRCLRHGT